VSDDLDLVLDMIGSVVDVDQSVGTYAGIIDGLPRVDYQGVRVPAALTGTTALIIGSQVRVVRVANKFLVLGNSEQKEPVGKVLSPSSGGKVLIENPVGSGLQVMLLCTPDIAFKAGDTVVIDWAAGGIVGYRLTAAPPPPTPVTPPPGPDTGPKPFEYTFQAAGSGSWRSGRWASDSVYYAQSYGVGMWHYGAQIRNTLADNAQISSLEIFVTVLESSGSNPVFGWHGFDDKPGGDFGLNDAFTINGLTRGFSGWVGLPASWINAGREGGFGVAVKGAGYRVFKGRGSDGESGRLRVRGVV